MNNITTIIIAIAAIVVIGCKPTKVANNNRDYAYEAYCDSIWEANPNYYLNVLVEGDEYCTYIEEHGEWWNN